jgi:hypothetical protein
MKRLAIVFWAILLAVVAGRLLIQTSLRNTVFPIFAHAGGCWIDGTDPYGDWTKFFRYSPSAAAAFAPWSMLPERVGEVVWRVFSVAAFVSGFFAFLRECVPSFDATRRWAAVLGSLPLAMMSVNNGQTNILLAGLLFFAFASAGRERWNRCAAALAAAVLLKLWPIAATGLLIVCFPKKLGPRFAAAIVIGILAPFLTQRWDYVVEMQRSWLLHLAADTRMEWNLLFGNRDFWLVLRLIGAPIDASQYLALQMASGTALAAWIGWMRWRGVSPSELIRVVAISSIVWMLGFGPATESCTYSLMGPVLAWAWLDPARRDESRLERILLLTSSGLFAVALASVVTPHSRFVEAIGLQPIGTALMFVRFLVSGRPARNSLSVADQPTASILALDDRRSIAPLPRTPSPAR